VDAVWPVAVLVAALVSARETISADDQPFRIVSNTNRRVLSLTRCPHPRKRRATRRRRAQFAPFAKGSVRGCRHLYWAQKATLFEVLRCEPIFDTGFQNAIEAVGGDALMPSSHLQWKKDLHVSLIFFLALSTNSQIH
jgi:hypothetical protein